MGFLCPPWVPKHTVTKTSERRGGLQSSVICAQFTESLNKWLFPLQQISALLGFHMWYGSPSWGWEACASVLPRYLTRLPFELAPLQRASPCSRVWVSHSFSPPPSWNLQEKPLPVSCFCKASHSLSPTPMQLNEFRLMENKSQGKLYKLILLSFLSKVSPEGIECRALYLLECRNGKEKILINSIQ